MLPCGDRTFLSRASKARQRLSTHDSVTIIADVTAHAGLVRDSRVLERILIGEIETPMARLTLEVSVK
jgi:hypothetical protein